MPLEPAAGVDSHGATRPGAPQPRGVAPAPALSRLSLLDGFALVREGQPVVLPAGAQRLVALLALGGPRSRAVTAGTLWPDVPEKQAQGSLRTALWRLQRTWPDLVAPVQQSIALDDRVEVDTERFVARAHATFARRAGDGPGSGSGDVGAETLADLSAGELLPGWYDDWVVFERERLRQLRLHALERLSAHLLDAGAFALALEAAWEAVRAEPLRESAHHALLTVHLAEGNVVEARRHFAHVRRLLWDELQVEPSPRLRELVGGLGPGPVEDGVSRPRTPPPRRAAPGS